jgi:hypothetical protein
MATITLNVNDEINNEFRNVVKSKFGVGKGILGKAIEEAIKKWIFEEKQKELSNEGLMMLKEGIWSKKGFNFNRDEIYDR